jgi:hypothetical protein
MDIPLPGSTFSLTSTKQLAFIIELPVNLPWTSIYAATQFQPLLLNGGDSSFELFDNIQYTNATGALVLPPIYTLSFHPLTTFVMTPVAASVNCEALSLRLSTILYSSIG